MRSDAIQPNALAAIDGVDLVLGATEKFKITDYMKTIFTEIIEKTIPGYFIFEDEKYVSILDKYPIKNVAIHARIGKQLYKGGVDLDSFQHCLDASKQKLYYNGDITSVEKYKELQERFPSIDHWMIGRGLIADPFLPSMIRDNTTEYPKDRYEIFKEFCTVSQLKYHGSIC